MKKHFILGSIFSLLIVALLGASNIPQSWTWDKTSQWFSVLMKDGGGTKFVASAPKQYVGCSSGCAVTLTGSPAFASTRSVFIPYKTIDGAWRLRLNIGGSVSSATLTGITFTITGVTFISAAIQSCSFIGANVSTPAYAKADSGTNTISIGHGSTAGVTGYWVSCDVELAGKPTWADAN